MRSGSRGPILGSISGVLEKVSGEEGTGNAVGFVDDEAVEFVLCVHSFEGVAEGEVGAELGRYYSVCASVGGFNQKLGYCTVEDSDLGMPGVEVCEYLALFGLRGVTIQRLCLHAGGLHPQDLVFLTGISTSIVKQLLTNIP